VELLPNEDTPGHGLIQASREDYSGSATVIPKKNLVLWGGVQKSSLILLNKTGLLIHQLEDGGLCAFSGLCAMPSRPGLFFFMLDEVEAGTRSTGRWERCERPQG
jgi:hypothetical protein